MGSIGWFKKWFKPKNEFEAMYREEKARAERHKAAYFKLKGQIHAVLIEAAKSEKKVNLEDIML
jgi:hypothetical protein